MRCTWCENRLAAYLEGTLSERARRAVAAHLRTCTACAALYDELRVVDGLLHTSRALPPAVDVVDAVMDGVRAHTGKQRPRTPLWLVGALYLIAAWLAIAALFASGATGALGTPLAALGATGASAYAAYTATLRAFGPLVPALAAFVGIVLFLDAALACAVVYFYRHLRPRLARHLVRTEFS